MNGHILSGSNHQSVPGAHMALWDRIARQSHKLRSVLVKREDVPFDDDILYRYVHVSGRTQKTVEECWAESMHRDAAMLVVDAIESETHRRFERRSFLRVRGQPPSHRWWNCGEIDHASDAEIIALLACIADVLETLPEASQDSAKPELLPNDQSDRRNAPEAK